MKTLKPLVLALEGIIFLANQHIFISSCSLSRYREAFLRVISVTKLLKRYMRKFVLRIDEFFLGFIFLCLYWYQVPSRLWLNLPKY